ncbi:hypothetical protein SUGI_0800120 [Cryptomeria japonica]|nr:hypothetical protein SUGI_0800120 [Cryptomeria japonica]
MLQKALSIAKYLSGCMASLSATIQLELPHVNILMKMDLVENKKEIEKFLDPDTRLLLLDLNQHMAPCFAKLNKSLVELIDDYSMEDAKLMLQTNFFLTCLPLFFLYW